MGSLAWLAAAWSMMWTPTVAQRRTIEPRRSGSARAAEIQPSEVTIVDLRPLEARVHEEASDDPSRQYHHRWIVRGHWRNQAVGEGRSERRITWIPSHIKGPAWAPLLASEKVMTWMR